MEIQPNRVKNSVDTSINSQPPQPSDGKVPLLVEAVIGFMLLSALITILHGISKITFFGLGLIPIAIGGLLIWSAIAIFKLQKKGYLIGLILVGLGAASNLYQLLVPGGRLLSECITVGISLVPVGILYYYRNRFIY